MANVSSINTSGADAKILGDLATLTEKMDLCHAMLNPGAADPKLSMQSEAMMAVVGFLEACAPRMVELVQAAASGALSEEVFAECLSVNDRLQKLLADVDTAALTETSASTTAASAPAADDITQELDDLFLGEYQPSSKAGGKTTGESDGDDDEDERKLPAVAAPSEDDFDAFFAERTTNI